MTAAGGLKNRPLNGYSGMARMLRSRTDLRP